MRHRITRTPGPVLTILALVFAWPVDPAGAQGFERVAFELWGIHLSSGQATLERGTGAGVGVVLGMRSAEWLGVGVAMVQLRSRSERDGVACAQFHPIPGRCEPDRLAEEVTVRSFRVSVLPALKVTDGLRIGGGVGISVSELTAESRGTATDRIGDLYASPSGHVGGFIGAALIWSPFFYVPVDIVIGATSHRIWFDGCRENPIYYAPYCGGTGLWEVRAGLSYRLEL